MSTNERGWKVAIAGECMTTRAFREHSEPEFLKIKEILDGADVSYAHLEAVFGEFSKLYPVRGNFLGTYLLSDPEIAKDLRWLGIKMLSLAHNHSFDFGTDGILSTMEACKDAGIVGAGAGRDLEEAREPGYYESANGRVALISTSSGNTPYESANLAKGSMRTRAGINPLGAQIRFKVPEDAAQQLREIGSELQILRTYDKNSRVPTGMKEGEFRFYVPSENSSVSSHAFSVGNEYGINSFCNPRDLKGNLDSIREAVKMSDLVLVAHHATVYERMTKTEPTKYALEFAHAAIDAGADAYFGHGWHKTLGVEIYKGKPIFYGLGSLFAQSQFSRRVPYDGYETWGHDVERLPSLRPSDEPLRPGMKPSQGLTWWSSALVELEYTPDKTIKAMTFHPVELGVDVAKEDKPISRRTGKHAEGRPQVATGDSARVILERIRDLSKQYGTEIRIEGDIGRWEV